MSEIIERLEAYVRLRAAGGLVLSVHRLLLESELPGPLPFNERVLLVILDRDGWELVSLLADDRRPGSIGMPGASLGHELIRHGYVPDRYHHAAAQQGIFGWVQVDGTGPDTIAPLGRSQSVTNVGPCWRLPVFRAEDAPQPCCCAESGVQQSCEHCSPRHQEQVYGHAIAAPVSSSGGQG